MRKPKPVYILDPIDDGDDLVVTVSSIGGQREAWQLGISQQRMLLGYLVRKLSVKGHDALIADLVEMLGKEPQEVPFSA